MPTPPEPQTTFDTSQNIRDSITNLDDDALRASLKECGWKKHLPAFVDENNVVLVGHRRMRIAAELGIEPVVVKLELGTGTAAENERRIIATTSNVGFAEMSIPSRRKLAVEFCQQGMTQTAVAAMLGVGQATISRDLEALFTVNNAPKPVTDKLGRKNTGRRGSGTKATKPKTTTTPADIPRAETAPRAVDGAPTPRAAEPAMTLDMISTKTGREQAEIFMRQYDKRQQAEMARKIAEIREQIRAASAKHFADLTVAYREKEKHYDLIINRWRGVMTKADYNSIMFCIHPDQYRNRTDEQRNAAQILWRKLEKMLVKAEATPSLSGLPTTREELLKRKAARDAAKAKRDQDAAHAH